MIDHICLSRYILETIEYRNIHGDYKLDKSATDNRILEKK